jgi:leucyl aminopeptidase
VWRVSTQPGYSAPTVTVATSVPKRGTGSSVLLVPVVGGSGDDAAPQVVGSPFLDAEAIGEIEVALRALGAKAGPEQLTRLHIPSLPVGSVLAVGLGAPRDEWPAEVIRRASGSAARALSGVASVITLLSELHLGAAVEGLILGAYQMHEFRSEKTAPKEPGLSMITALSTATGAKKDAARAVAIATAVATARDLVNTPPSHLHPDEFARRAKILGTGAGLTVEVLDEKALSKQGYGGIIGVGKGSVNPPRLVRLTYRGGKGKAPKVALIGKGITFDTGGISIKPAAQMHHMTSDMAGAAAVVATMVLIADQKLPIDVIATVPMAENMPSATAQRPGDVLTQYGGITVEVLNTDAEGRLVLADALVLASEESPAAIVDLATLTGACLVALGDRIAGLMANDDAFRDRVAAAAARAGERVWPLPLPADYRPRLDSRIADIANIGGGRYGGTLTAGLFLQEFVGEGIPWAHLDIAGPAHLDEPDGEQGPGGTGFGVRTLVSLVTGWGDDPTADQDDDPPA